MQGFFGGRSCQRPRPSEFLDDSRSVFTYWPPIYPCEVHVSCLRRPFRGLAFSETGSTYRVVTRHYLACVYMLVSTLLYVFGVGAFRIVTGAYR